MFEPPPPLNYDYQCSFLNGPLGSDESVTYGINYRSPLNEIDGFHTASCQMITHVLFEGVLHIYRTSAYVQALHI